MLPFYIPWTNRFWGRGLEETMSGFQYSQYSFTSGLGDISGRRGVQSIPLAVLPGLHSQTAGSNYYRGIGEDGTISSLFIITPKSYMWGTCTSSHLSLSQPNPRCQRHPSSQGPRPQSCSNASKTTTISVHNLLTPKQGLTINFGHEVTPAHVSSMRYKWLYFCNTLCTILKLLDWQWKKKNKLETPQKEIRHLLVPTGDCRPGNSIPSSSETESPGLRLSWWFLWLKSLRRMETERV